MLVLMGRLRVLRAAALLKTFTAESLAYAAKVPVATTRTVLQRDAAVFTRVDVVSTGRAGGQPHVYGLAEPAFSELLAKVGGPDIVGPARPRSLDAAYAYLIGRMIMTDDVTARREYIARARLALAKAENEWRASDRSRIELHRAIASDLFRIAELEMSKAPDFSEWRDLSVRLAEAADALKQHGEASLAASILSRFLTSRVQQAVCTKASAPRTADAPLLSFHREAAQRSSLEHARVMASTSTNVWDG